MHIYYYNSHSEQKIHQIERPLKSHEMNTYNLLFLMIALSYKKLTAILLFLKTLIYWQSITLRQGHCMHLPDKFTLALLWALNLIL